MATIKDVASKARVSAGTVSNVLSGSVPVSKKLRQRVLDAIKQLDYHPDHVARSLKIRQTRMIAIVVSDISSPAVPQLVRGAEDVAWREKYMLLAFNSDQQLEREQHLMEELRSRRIDGIVLIPAAGAEHAHIAALRDAGTPIVCLNRELDLNFDCVLADHAAGARECAAHLISLGHRRIAMLAGECEDETMSQRVLGYRQAMDDAKISAADSVVAQDSGWLTATPRPTAVIAPDAVCAVGLLQTLAESNLQCPEDIALAAFGDAAFAGSLRPALTAIAEPSFEMGTRAMELLLLRMGDPHRPPERVVIGTKLIVRESTGSSRGVSN